MGNVYHYRILVKPADPLTEHPASDYFGYVWIVRAKDDDFIVDEVRMLSGGWNRDYLLKTIDKLKRKKRKKIRLGVIQLSGSQ